MILKTCECTISTLLISTCFIVYTEFKNLETTYLSYRTLQTSEVFVRMLPRPSWFTSLHLTVISSRTVTYFLFRDTTFHLALALSASLRPKCGTSYLFTSANLKHTLPSDVILRRNYFISAHLAPLAAPVMRLDSLPRLWRYINLLLTYLLTYLQNYR